MIRGNALRKLTSEPPRNAGTSLISDDDLISELLEDVRCEKSSYEIFQRPSGSNATYPASYDVVGLYILSGSVDVVLRDGEVLHLDPGHFILLLPGQPYGLNVAQAREPAKMGQVTYRFDMGRARLFFKILPHALVISHLDKKEVDWQLSLANLIAQQRDSTGPGSAAINRRLVEAAFIGVIQQFVKRDPALREHMADPLMARISPSLQAMHHHPHKPWTIASLARLAAMSRTLFAMTFVKSTGETPRRYLTRVRMERARGLLQCSHLPVAVVAHRAGYGTDAAFARAFKRQFGVSPGQCRAERWTVGPIV
jgi:AraC-like DNA-binding protein